MKEGVFWILPKEEREHGFEVIFEFNGVLGHSEIWEMVIRAKKELAQYEYDYFPRGRIWIKSSKATIFLDKKINTPSVITQINQIFCLNGNYEIQTDS